MASYNATLSRSVYMATRTDRGFASLWSVEKLVHDMAAAGFISFFEGPGDDPTGLDGYSVAKIWLRQSAGSTNPTTSGTVRYYAGSGSASDIANWPVMAPGKLAEHIGQYTPDGSVADYATRAAAEAADIPSAALIVRVSGFTAAGDCAGESALYLPVSSPGTPKSYHFQSNDGQWWQYAGTRINVKHLGAVGDDTTDDSDVWNDAIYLAGTTGGGVVYGPEGTYKVSLATVVTSTGSIRICALACPYDNVILEGDGKDLTTIKCAEGGVYGAIQFVETPLENGRTKIYRSGFRKLTIDGNYPGATGSFSIGQPLVYLVGTGYCKFTEFRAKNSSHYGMGVQNGGHVGLEISDFEIEETNQDGIDIKNNADARTATVTIASPAVWTAASHDLLDDDAVRITTTGALPTGFATLTTYYVVNKTSSTFQLAATIGGAPINSSGSQSGTHTVLGPIDINASIRISRGVFRNVGKGTDGPNPFAGIDFDGIGTVISDISMLSCPTDAGATLEAAVRIKQGQAGDTLGRGTGGQMAMVSNIYAYRQPGATTGEIGVAVSAPHAVVLNSRVRGEWDTGFALRQPATVDGCVADGPTVGYDVLGVSGSASAWPYLNGGENATLNNVVALNCTTGIQTTRAVFAMRPRIEDCTTGISWLDASPAGGYFAATFSNNGTDVSLNGSAMATAPQSMLFQDGIIHQFMRNLLQGVAVLGDSAGNRFVSYSDPTNSKVLAIDATTDESNTASSGGNAPAIHFRTYGSTRFQMDATGNFATSGGTAIVDAAAGLRLPSYTAANIADAAHAVNTANKAASKLVYDSTNTRVMVATGANATDPWKVADASATVTPA